MTEQWSELERWLRSPDAGWFVDGAVLGNVPLYEADEILEDFGIVPSRSSRIRLGRAVDEALCSGEA